MQIKFAKVLPLAAAVALVAACGKNEESPQTKLLHLQQRRLRRRLPAARPSSRLVTRLRSRAVLLTLAKTTKTVHVWPLKKPTRKA